MKMSYTDRDQATGDKSRAIWWNMNSCKLKVGNGCRLFCLISFVLIELVWPQSLLALQGDAEVDFNRDVKPILSDRCFLCHGPDAEARESDLRLDTESGVAGVIVAGQPEMSDLIARIISKDDDHMPPIESNLSLSPQEVKTLDLWVSQGAKWEQHWSFVPPKKIQLPPAKGAWGTNAIDQFILSRLQQEELNPSLPASKSVLLRRITFDLTGLPPTIEELRAFEADVSADAYETVVDRLLASQRYGERMTSDWLDVARYSDTYGYQVDRDRFVWPWRDWVIRSFNQNMSYDQFLTEQIAGDLLPEATDDQILATTFNRLHPQKVEGGSVEEEFRVEYVADRTHTFAMAFLGLTLECARCHDHKYDPLSQKEYYQLFSYFNNIDESGLYSYFTNSIPTPTLRLLKPDQKNNLAALKASVIEIERNRPDSPLPWKDSKAIEKVLALEGAVPVEEVDFNAVGGGNQKATDARGNPAVKLSGDDAIGLKTGNFTRYQPFSVSLSMNTPDKKDRAVIFHRSRAWTDAASRGYQLLIEDGKLSASLIHFWPGNAIRVKTKQDIPLNQWIDVAVVYDGSVDASGLSIFVDGQAMELEIVKNKLTKNITGGGGNNIAIGERFRDRGFTNGLVSSFKVYDRQLSSLEVALAHSPELIKQSFLTQEASGEFPESQLRMLAEHLELNDLEAFAAYRAKLKVARQQLCGALDGATEIMVMRELEQPREAFVLGRGLYSSRGEKVSAATPSVFPAMDDTLPRNRLGLARWLTDPSHPLTSRVAVNHYWQLVFGEGIVRTPEDFGSQGALPTHPELLDWLALDFVENGWDVKRLLKQLVMSSVYRQSSQVSDELLKRDPENELLARAPSYRLTAEMLRDNVLATSGLMVEKIGGSPVRPYELAASFKPVKPDGGEGLYRRSLYTYWKRTGPGPVMMVLDASKRDVCQVKRERTSSPLQALAMLNGPQFVEAARGLSHRLIAQNEGQDSGNLIDQMFLTLTTRLPLAKERSVIEDLYRSQLEFFQANPDSAIEYLSNGKFGDYGKLRAGAKILFPANNHDFRIGMTPEGTEKFQGEFGRASAWRSVLTAEEINKLYGMDRNQVLDANWKVEISNLKPIEETSVENVSNKQEISEPFVFENSSKLKFTNGLTLEAWIKPSRVGTGRIWDKITPGSGPGLLLDLHGGLRFVCGSVIRMADRSPPAGQWSHLVCTADMKSGQVRFYINGEPAGGDFADLQQVDESEDLAVLAAWSSVANALFNYDECVTKR
ncbi:MAG: DUF1553 domain-containing protein [Pirellulales bacterium]